MLSELDGHNLQHGTSEGNEAGKTAENSIVIDDEDDEGYHERLRDVDDSSVKRKRTATDAASANKKTRSSELFASIATAFSTPKTTKTTHANSTQENA